MNLLISSAIKFKRQGNDYFHIMCGKRHWNILEEMFKLGIVYDKKTAKQGFMTDDNRFLDRSEAIYEAKESGQLSKDFPNDHSLFSEDIWPNE